MHAIVAAVHEADIDIESFFYRYLYENTDYFEVEEEYSFDEVQDMIESELRNMPADPNDYRKTFYDDLTNKTGLDRIRAYAEWYSYELEEDRIVRYGNPYGECDWYVIGGRWENTLIDFAGEGHNTLRVQDINLEHPQCIQNVYKVVNIYKDSDTMEDGGDEKDFRKLVDEAIEWSEHNEQEVFITLVDIHE